MGSVPSTALSHITGQHISWLKCAAVCAHSTQWWCQHYNSVNNMLRSCLVCMIETSLGGPSLSLSLRSGRICLAGRQAGITRFLARRGGWVSGLFPALRVHSRWLGGLCVIKGPSSASTQVWNAAPRRCWSAFVCSNQFVATRKSWAEG